MSCSIIAIPWLLASIVASAGLGVGKEPMLEERLYGKNIAGTSSYDITPRNYDDISSISEEHFIEQKFETVFMDKNILRKTLEEHGVHSIQEDAPETISGNFENYTLTFEKPEPEKPYYLTIGCRETDNAEEKFNDISTEYALNVQEEVYLNIIEKLKNNDMTIESEEVTEDNTIVLTVNID